MSAPGFAPALRAVSRWLERSVALAPLVGVLLALPAVGRERVLDDHVLELVARESSDAVAPGSGVDLFRFASGDAGDNLALMAQGSMLPWYSDPELKITFYRPLSSLTHRLDFLAWPEHPELMYAHSLAWLGALALLAWRLYRRIELGPAVTALATWLYALNDANGTVVSWLSNRNALISAVGAAGALLAHDRARRDGHGPSRWFSPLWLALALFAGELGASTWAYLLAYALVLEAGSLWARVRSLLPHAAVTLGWAACYLASGAGTRASGVYLHPLADMPAFVAALPERALVLLGAAFGPFPAELAFLGPLPLAPLWPAAAVLVLVGLAWLGRRLELWRDPVARFWALGLTLGLLPVAASFPSDRLLLLVNLGAMALVARVGQALLAPAGRGVLAPAGRGVLALAAGRGVHSLAGGRGLHALGGGLLVVHALLAPLLLPLRARQIQELARASERAFAGLDAIEGLEHKTVIVLGAPTDFFVGYLQAERAARGLPRPAHLYWVANPEAALELRVTGERTLSAEREGGFFVTPPEALYRRASAPLLANASVGLPGLTARVSGVTGEGRPARVEFRFDAPIGDERFVFLALRQRRYERVSPVELERLRLEPAPPLSEFLSSPARN